MSATNDRLPFWLEASTGSTEEALQAAEAYVGHRLPDSLRALLREQNGGVSNYATCGSAGDRYPVLPMMGVAADASVDTIVRAHDVKEAFGVPEGVVVFAAMGDAWLGLDYRDSSVEPAVLYGDSERDAVGVSATFDRFLDSLGEE